MENKEFFDEYANYDEYVQANQGEVYANTQRLLDGYLESAHSVLDIGNGGVINYEYSHLERLDCVDVSVSDTVVAKYKPKTNVRFIAGDALELPLSDCAYEYAIIQYVLHHLAGKNVSETKERVGKCLLEALRVLKADGRILIVEPMMPHWMFLIESCLFGLLRLFCKLIKHGVVFQYSLKGIEDIVSKIDAVKIYNKIQIDQGKYMVVFKKRIPAKLLPLRVHLIEIGRHA